MEEWSQLIVAENATMARDRFLALAHSAGAARFARQHDASAGRADRWDQLRRITAPTLLLWGEDDGFVPVEVGRRMVEAMPNARLVALQRCRHFPSLEQPGEATEIARDWLSAILSSSNW